MMQRPITSAWLLPALAWPALALLITHLCLCSLASHLWLAFVLALPPFPHCLPLPCQPPCWAGHHPTVLSNEMIMTTPSQWWNNHTTTMTLLLWWQWPPHLLYLAFTLFLTFTSEIVPLPTSSSPSTWPCLFELEHLSPTLDCVLLSLTTRLLPQPCIFEPKCSSATPLCQFKHNHSSPISTMCSWAQLLVPHLPHMLLSPITHLPPPLCQFEPNHLCSTSMHSWAWLLIFHSHHVNSSWNAYLLPPPCQFKPDCLSHCINWSATTHVSPPPCVLKPNSLSPTLTSGKRGWNDNPR